MGRMRRVARIGVCGLETTFANNTYAYRREWPDETATEISFTGEELLMWTVSTIDLVALGPDPDREVSLDAYEKLAAEWIEMYAYVRAEREAEPPIPANSRDILARLAKAGDDWSDEQRKLRRTVAFGVAAAFLNAEYGDNRVPSYANRPPTALVMRTERAEPEAAASSSIGKLQRPVGNAGGFFCRHARTRGRRD